MKIMQKLTSSLRRPITRERLGFWVSVVLGFLFGRSPKCAKCGRCYRRTFPIVFSGKVYLFGLHADFVRPYFTSQFELSFECVKNCIQVSEISQGDRQTCKPSLINKKITHLILGHQEPAAIEASLNKFKKMAQGVPIVLLYGGPRSQFKKLDWDKKVFIADKKLRGPTSSQDHRGLFKAIANLPENLIPSNSWVFFSEADCLPLQNDYARKTVAYVEKKGGDFAACWLRDQKGSNGDWYQREIRKPHWLKTLTPRANPANQESVFHCLGCLMAFRAEFLKKWRLAKHPPQSIYFEVYIPTFAFYNGLRLVDLCENSNTFSHCRYRPEYSPQEIKDAFNSGALFVHPVKNIFQYIE